MDANSWSPDISSTMDRLHAVNQKRAALPSHRTARMEKTLLNVKGGLAMTRFLIAVMTTFILLPQMVVAAVLNVGETRVYQNSFQTWIVSRINSTTITFVEWDKSGTNWIRNFCNNKFRRVPQLGL
jgi:hypothetical protein